MSLVSILSSVYKKSGFLKFSTVRYLAISYIIAELEAMTSFYSLGLKLNSLATFLEKVALLGIKQLHGLHDDLELYEE